MDSFNEVARPRAPRATVSETLALPLVSLDSVPSALAELLGGVGVVSVADLAGALAFRVASAFAAVGGVDDDPEVWPRNQLGVEQHRTEPVGAVLSAGPQILPGISPLAGELLSGQGFDSVASLATWDVFVAARRLAVAAAESPSTGGGGDDYLRPLLGEHALQRSEYRVVALHSFVGAPADLTGEVDQAAADSGGIVIPRGGLRVGEGRRPEAAPAVGFVATVRTDWVAGRLTLGSLLNSVALAPGESTRIAVSQWWETAAASTSEETSQTEALSAELSRLRAIDQVDEAMLREATSGWTRTTSEASDSSFSLGGAFGFIGKGFGGLFGGGGGKGSASQETTVSTRTFGGRDVAASLSQRASDRIGQLSTSVRGRRATAITEVAESGGERLSTRTITNYNHMHALTVQYFEVVQLFDVITCVHDVTPVLFLPFQAPDLADSAVVERFRYRLADRALSADVAEALRGADSVVVTDAAPPPSWGDPNDEGSLAGEFLQLRQGAAAALEGELTDDGLRLRNETQFGRIWWPLEWRGGAAGRRVVLRRQDDRSIELQVVVNPDGPDMFVLSPPTPLRAGDRLVLEAQAGAPTNARIEIALWLNGARRNWYVPVGEGADLSSLTLFEVSAGPLPELSNDVLAHLAANQDHYAFGILDELTLDDVVAALAQGRFQGRRLDEVVIPRPISRDGNLLAFQLAIDDLATLGETEPWEFLNDLNLVGDLAAQTQTETRVALPSDGVFAEAVLGWSNSAERLDLSRFWNWQDSPIPIVASDIADLQQTTAPNNTTAPETGALAAPIINLMVAPGLPDPTTGALDVLRSVQPFGPNLTVEAARSLGADTLAASIASHGLANDVTLAALNQAAGLAAGGRASNPSTTGAALNQARELDTASAATSPATSPGAPARPQRPTPPGPGQQPGARAPGAAGSSEPRLEEEILRQAVGLPPTRTDPAAATERGRSGNELWKGIVRFTGLTSSGLDAEQFWSRHSRLVILEAQPGTWLSRITDDYLGDALAAYDPAVVGLLSIELAAELDARLEVITTETDAPLSGSPFGPSATFSALRSAPSIPADPAVFDPDRIQPGQLFFLFLPLTAADYEVLELTIPESSSPNDLAPDTWLGLGARFKGDVPMFGPAALGAGAGLSTIVDDDADEVAFLAHVQVRGGAGLGYSADLGIVLGTASDPAEFEGIEPGFDLEMTVASVEQFNSLGRLTRNAGMRRLLERARSLHPGLGVAASEELAEEASSLLTGASSIVELLKPVAALAQTGGVLEPGKLLYLQIPFAGLGPHLWAGGRLELTELIDKTDVE
ncbi:MAG: hypothetical protein AAFZ07_25870 [Actinomycetota bacterium]